jgi:hypothetical protein
LNFAKDQVKDIWDKGLNDLYSQVPFDGILLKHNELRANQPNILKNNDQSKSNLVE